MSLGKTAFVFGAGVAAIAASASLAVRADQTDQRAARTQSTSQSFKASGETGGAGGLITTRGRKLDLQNCKPASNCYAADKPCYMEIAQGDPTIGLVGMDGGGSPVQPLAAYRIRLCTDAADPVCKDASANQRLNYYFFNYVNPADPYVLEKQLSTTTGVLDTGPYQQVGPQNFFGVVCLDGAEPCRIAWQYCELPAPDPGKTQ